jgi:beta-lactamase class A
MMILDRFVNIIAIFFMALPTFATPLPTNSTSENRSLKMLEETFDGKIGIYAVNTGNHEVIAYRANERFPVQSTMKLIGVAALLKEADKNPGLLKQTIHYKQNDLMYWHPITGQHLKTGMSLKVLSEAAMTYSDNTAMNVITKKLGGPASITEFAHSIGNQTFNVEHYEGELNSDPTNPKDSSTPKDMAISLQKLLLDNALSKTQRDALTLWMKNNTTSYKRIRAGTPIGWAVMDKTGSGDYGIANDIAIMESPLCKPIILAIYTVQNKKYAKSQDDIVAKATSIVMDQFAKNDPCFKAIYL